VRLHATVHSLTATDGVRLHVTVHSLTATDGVRMHVAVHSLTATDGVRLHATVHSLTATDGVRMHVAVHSLTATDGVRMHVTVHSLTDTDGVRLHATVHSLFCSAASLAAIATPIGCLVTGVLLDWLGRRRTLMVVNTPAVLGWLLIATASHSEPWFTYQLYAGRLLTGLATGMSSSPATVYVSEVADKSLRGMMVTWSSVGEYATAHRATGPALLVG
jgi:MFS family permease